MKRSLTATAGLLICLGLTACPSAPPSEVSEPSAPTPSTVEPAEDRSGKAVDCFVGAVVPREETDIAAEVEGLVGSIGVRVGDRVEEGDALAVLDTRALRHRLAMEDANLKAAVAERQKKSIEAEQSTQEHQRRIALEGLVSREERDASQTRQSAAAADLAVAEAQVAQVQARLHELRDSLDRSTLRAPFTGLVSRRYLDPGSRTAVGTPVVRLMRLDTLLVRFAVPADQRRELQPGRDVRVELVADGRAFAATVEQVAPEVDPASLLLFVEARLRTDGPGPLFGAEARVSPTSPDGDSPSCLN